MGVQCLCLSVCVYVSVCLCVCVCIHVHQLLVNLEFWVFFPIFKVKTDSWQNPVTSYIFYIFYLSIERRKTFSP